MRISIEGRSSSSIHEYYFDILLKLICLRSWNIQRMEKNHEEWKKCPSLSPPWGPSLAAWPCACWCSRCECREAPGGAGRAPGCCPGPGPPPPPSGWQLSTCHQRGTELRLAMITILSMSQVWAVNTGQETDNGIFYFFFLYFVFTFPQRILKFTAGLTAGLATGLTAGLQDWLWWYVRLCRPLSPDWWRPHSGLTQIGLRWQDAGVLRGEAAHR